jgi:hypothetical protein
MKTDTALVLGNGPSLDMIDPACFDHFTTFGTNRVYVMFPKWRRECDNIVITDRARIREIGDSYRHYRGQMFVGSSHNIYPRVRELRRVLGRDFTPLKQMIVDRRRQRLLSRMDRWPAITRIVRNRKTVSFDFERGFNFGGTVGGTAAQIAVALGFNRVLLVGMDAGSIDGKTHLADLPHFPPEFQQQLKDRRYEDPRPVGELSERSQWRSNNIRLKMEPFFVLLQVAMEEVGCELVDCTVNGKLRFISKGKLEDYIEAS